MSLLDTVQKDGRHKERVKPEPKSDFEVKEALGRTISEELLSVIHTHLSEDFIGEKDEDGESNSPLRPNGKLVYQDKEYVILGMALRMTEKEIRVLVNQRRHEAGLPPVQSVTVQYYRKRFDKLIDEVYAVATLRIGEIYSLADKLVRVDRLNQMGEIVLGQAMTRLKDDPDDLAIKMGNLGLRILDRMNVEMGSPVGMVKRILPKEDEDNPDKIQLKPGEVKGVLAEVLSERYAGQLPDAISQKFTFSDYEQCALGEKFSDFYWCHSKKMTKSDDKEQCQVQKGTVHRCPCFMNKSLLNDKAWLQRARDQHLTVRKIAALIGCEEYDEDARDFICYFLKKHDIIQRIPRLKSGVDERDEETLQDLVKQDFEQDSSPESPEPLESENNVEVSEPNREISA